MNIPRHKRLNKFRTSASEGKLLLLDDDIEYCDILRSLLEWHWYEVAVVHRGVDGIREIMSRDYDAIICDMMMPTMPGDMFYLAVQQMKPHLSKRFIFITAHQGNPKIEGFLKIAAGEVLYKPLATNQLLEKIAKIMSATGTMMERNAAGVQPEWPQPNPDLTCLDDPVPEDEPILIPAPNMYDSRYFEWKRAGGSQG